MAPFEPMPDPYPAPAAPEFCDSVHAAALLAIDPLLSGIIIRARFGPTRDAFLQKFQSLLPAATPFKKMPLNIAPDRLLGGLDLAATLSAGRPIMLRGLLAEAAGGVLVLAMAERISTATAAQITAAIDNAIDSAIDNAGNFTTIALDEGVNEDEAAPAALADRLAFTIMDATLPGTDEAWPSAAQITAARAALHNTATAADTLERLCRLAAMFEIPSPRAVLFAIRAARAAAALAGRDAITDNDIALATRLVLLPRAQVMPNFTPPEAEAEEPEAEPEAEEPEAAPEPGNDNNESEETAADETPETTADASKALLPPALLEALLSGQTPRRTARGNGQSGRVQNLTRGRPAGIRPGRLGNGARLSIIDTLRAAIPWQTIRKTSHNTTRIAIRADDFRLRRFKENERVISIFAVDASGSAALNRLGEAKGAIQLLLADCYIRRDQVALLAFRNRSAELLLPPTNALARAKRSLNGLPGGGPTPLATGIDAARALAESERRKGVQPLLVFLTDGGANIGRDGQPGRAQAGADALNAARLCRAAGLKALVVDTAPRPQAFVAKLAVEMGARYLPLPYADAAALSRAVQQQEPAYASRAA